MIYRPGWAVFVGSDICGNEPFDFWVPPHVYFNDRWIIPGGLVVTERTLERIADRNNWILRYSTSHEEDGMKNGLICNPVSKTQAGMVEGRA